jgi:hypothetical protein
LQRRSIKKIAPDALEPPPASEYSHAESTSRTKKKRRSPPKGKGGRYGFDDYPNAPIEEIENTYQAGGSCPCCSCGKLYESEERQGIQYDAAPPLQVKRHRKKVLRCNVCGEAQIPPKNIPRVTPEAVSSVIVQRALGIPLNRLSRLQGLYGIPVAASTLWRMAEDGWHQGGSALLVLALS